MGKDRPPKSSLLRRAGGVLLVLAISFVLGELVLRLVHRVHPTFIYYDATYDRFRGKPGSLFRGHRLNELGFNDRPFVRDSGDRYRIVALGDSFAFGVVPYPDNYLTLLEQELGHAHAAVDVLNMGIPRTGPVEQLSLLVNEGLAYEPDLVLVSFFVGNDFLDVRRATAKRKTVTDRSFVMSLLRYAFVVRPNVEPGQVYGSRPYDDDSPTFSEQTFLKLVARRAVVFRTDWQPFAELLDRTVESLQDIERVCARRGIALSVVLIPEEIQLDPALQRALMDAFKRFRRDNTDFERPNRMLYRRLTELEVDVLDLYPPFREAAGDARLYKPRDTHWNLAGNRLAAELITRHLVDQAIVPVTQP